MSTTTIPDFLSSVASATDAAARADRIALADLVGALAAGKRPSIDAAATASLLQRLGLSGENLEELVATRQRLDAHRLEAATGPEARAHAREVADRHREELAAIEKGTQELRARREQADRALATARQAVAETDAAARQAADATGELLRLLAPSLEHEMRTAASGVKVNSGKLNELRRRIGEDEGELATAADAEFTRPELKAAKVAALEESLERLRRELAEVEEQHARAQKEHEALAAEARLLCGEEVGR